MGIAKIKCKKCGDIIESLSHYDFRKCSCGACAVDGGDDYFRVLGNKDDFEIIPKETDNMTPAKRDMQE